MPVLGLRDIHKSFGGIVAVQGFGLDLHAAEIVALVGDNGAGKSTLIKMIAGVLPPTRGVISINGVATSLPNPAVSKEQGIEVVYQDLALANLQQVYMNMFLGREMVGSLGLLDRKRMIKESEDLLEELDVRVPSVKATIQDLSGGQRQGVAIARATHWASKLVLLDEPTAALGVAETAKAEELIVSLRRRNLAVLLVSHNLDQVFRLADRICVLRRGEQVGIRETAKTSKNEVVAMITGVN